MKQVFILVFFIVASARTQAQFEKVYGGALPESFRCVTPVSGGNFLCGGLTKSFGHGNTKYFDYYVVKTNSTGDTLWTRIFGTDSLDNLNNVVELPDGNYLISGVAYTLTNGNDIYSIKLDPSGGVIWSKFYGGTGNQNPIDVILVNDTIVYCGLTTGNAGNGQDFYVMRTDLAGNFIDSHSYGNSSNQSAYTITRSIDGGYLLAGYTTVVTQDIWLVKTDAAFNLQWSQTFFGSSLDYAFDVAQDATGNIFILGDMPNSTDTAALTIIKTDANGLNPVYKHPSPGPGDYGYHLEPLSSGGYLLTGLTHVPNKASEILLEKLNANADTVWVKHFGGADNELGWWGVPITGGGFIVGGETIGFGNTLTDAYLVRTDANGNPPCPPVVSFTPSDNNFCEDELVFFNNTTVSSKTFNWTVDGNLFSTDNNGWYYFDHDGTFNVTLTACAATSSQNIVVNSKPPVNFTYATDSNEVSFVLNPAVVPVTIEWNFGDNTALNTIDVNPVHDYAAPGSYWVKVSVTDANGCDSTYLQQISLSFITGIQTPAHSLSWDISPNPAHDFITINTIDMKESEATLMDASGKVLKKIQVNPSSKSLYIGDLLPALYFIRINSESETAIAKLVIQ